MGRCIGLLRQRTLLGETSTYKAQNLDSLVKKNGLQDRIGLKQIKKIYCASMVVALVQ
jgi:hypothetical protein